ncbi:MAG TPA: helix-turn-helix transcriptional regulator [Terriglobales bacterium]|nr:helix-turn-helix transcriptional regulator [Terriglobales bacterium]
MPLISSIRLNVLKKLKEDRGYRQRFFRGQAADEIAISIRSLREKRKKRQADLAKKAGMKQSAISRIEQADYFGWSFRTLFRVADALDARLRIIFEPTETVIADYEKREKETQLNEQFTNVHTANALIKEMASQELPIMKPDSQALRSSSLSAQG